MIRIHTFGDSHSEFGWNKITNPMIQIICHHLGPKLMFSFGRDGTNLLDIKLKKYNVRENDHVCFSFGEIDCRCHIQKYISVKNNYMQIIDNLVDKYFEKIKESVSNYKNIQCCIYNIPPPIQKHTTIEFSKLPFLGTDEERKTYVKYMNNILKKKCQELKFIFINIYDDYCDENGYINKQYNDKTHSGVHIDDPIFLEQFLIKNLL